MGGDYVNSLRFDYERVGKDESISTYRVLVVGSLRIR